MQEPLDVRRLIAALEAFDPDNDGATSYREAAPFIAAEYDRLTRMSERSARLNEPTTDAGRSATRGIKSGALPIWSDDGDDPIAVMIAAVEAEARQQVRGRISAAVEAALAPYPNVNYIRLAVLAAISDASA